MDSLRRIRRPALAILVGVATLATLATAPLVAPGCSRREPPGDSALDGLNVTVTPDACSRWSNFVCAHTAEEDSLCGAARKSAGLLTPGTCGVALAHKAYAEQRLAQRQRSCDALADKVCGDLAGMTRFCKMVREAIVRYSPDQCVDLLRDYPKTLAQLTKQANADRLSAARAAALLAGDPPAFGPPDAKLQLVEFVDYESRFSAQTAAIVRKLAAKYPGELHFVIRQFPLPDNPHAYLAAQAALAAGAQGKYWQMHDKLIAHHDRLQRASLLEYAREIGLDVRAFQAALDHERYAAAVDADIALGKASNVIGMPTVYVNGERLLNSVDEAATVAAVEEYLQR